MYNESDVAAMQTTIQNAVQNYLTANPPSSLPTGSTIMFVGDEAQIPSGWLPCTGRTIGKVGSGAFYESTGDALLNLYLHLAGIANDHRHTALSSALFRAVTSPSGATLANWNALIPQKLPDFVGVMPIQQDLDNTGNKFLFDNNSVGGVQHSAGYYVPATFLAFDHTHTLGNTSISHDHGLGTLAGTTPELTVSGNTGFESNFHVHAPGTFTAYKPAYSHAISVGTENAYHTHAISGSLTSSNIVTRHNGTTNDELIQTAGYTTSGTGHTTYTGHYLMRPALPTPATQITIGTAGCYVENVTIAQYGTLRLETSSTVIGNTGNESATHSHAASTADHPAANLAVSGASGIEDVYHSHPLTHTHAAAAITLSGVVAINTAIHGHTLDTYTYTPTYQIKDTTNRIAGFVLQFLIKV